MLTVSYRRAVDSDAVAVAGLHADSWRRHYRGAYSDDFLDGPVEEERLAVWTARLAQPSGTATVLAELDDHLVGFVHLILDVDPIFGALIDNLHVRHDAQRLGIGAELMAHAVDIVTNSRPGSQMYLWVLEQNSRAQAFYRSIGGRQVDRKHSTPPGGGTITGIRYVWRNPSVLLNGRRG